MISTNEVEAVARLVCASVREIGIVHPRADSAVVTVSVGAATMLAGNGRRPADLLARADDALYDAKAKGRDRVSVKVNGNLGSHEHEKQSRNNQYHRQPSKT